jgi:hypothetical protein
LTGERGAVPIRHPIGKMQGQVEADERFTSRPFAVENPGCAFRDPVLNQPLSRRKLRRSVIFSNTKRRRGELSAVGRYLRRFPPFVALERLLAAWATSVDHFPIARRHFSVNSVAPRPSCSRPAALSVAAILVLVFRS